MPLRRDLLGMAGQPRLRRMIPAIAAGLGQAHAGQPIQTRAVLHACRASDLAAQQQPMQRTPATRL